MDPFSGVSPEDDDESEAKVAAFVDTLRREIEGTADSAAATDGTDANSLSKYGLTNISREAVHCLSLGVEEYLRGLLNGAIEVAKQRVDLGKKMHQIVTATDILNKIVSINQKAQELLPQRNKNKEKVNNCKTAGNVAERAALGGDYLALNRQLISERTRQKHEGLIKDFTSQAKQPNFEETFHITLDDLIAALKFEPDESKNLWIRGLCERRQRSSKKQ